VASVQKSLLKQARSLDGRKHFDTDVKEKSPAQPEIERAKAF
jgi:hypothetical protein